MGLKPVIQSLVLADHVYIDANSGKKVIAGTFNHMTSSEFPTQFKSSKYAFLSMTDLHGSLNIELHYVDLQTNEILFELSDMTIESEDPLATVEMVVEIPPLPMPHEGAYAFEVHAGGEMLGFLRIFVSETEQDSESDADVD